MAALWNVIIAVCHWLIKTLYVLFVCRSQLYQHSLSKRTPSSGIRVGRTMGRRASPARKGAAGNIGIN